jgi:hypothetical protein
MSTVVTSWGMYKTNHFSREFCLLLGSELQHLRLFHGTNPGISDELISWREKGQTWRYGSCILLRPKITCPFFFFFFLSPPSKFRLFFYCAVNLYETIWNERHMSTADNVVIRCLTRKTNPRRTYIIINQSLCNFSTNLKEYEVILRLLFLPCRRQHGVSSVVIVDKTQEEGHSCGF